MNDYEKHNIFFNSNIVLKYNRVVLTILSFLYDTNVPKLPNRAAVCDIQIYYKILPLNNPPLTSARKKYADIIIQDISQ